MHRGEDLYVPHGIEPEFLWHPQGNQPFYYLQRLIRFAFLNKIEIAQGGNLSPLIKEGHFTAVDPVSVDDYHALPALSVDLI